MTSIVVPTRARSTLFGLAAIPAILLGGCSSGDTTVTPSAGGATPSASAAAPAFHATTFSTVVPRGWTNLTTNPSALASVNSDGTIDMLLVAADGGHIDARVAPQPVPDDQLSIYVGSVSQNGATNLSQAQAFSIDGSSGVYITYNLMSSTGVALRDQDMVVNHGGDTYDIVLNTAQTNFALDLTGLQSVLDGWRWSSS